MHVRNHDSHNGGVSGRSPLQTVDVAPDAAATSVDDRRAEATRRGAFFRWETAGRPVGDGVEFWLAAEKDLGADAAGQFGGGNSQDADRHLGVRHPASQKR
jgi:hypothetical protein